MASLWLRGWLLATLALLLPPAGPRPTASPWDRRVDEVWALRGDWDQEAERGFGDFVARLGEAVRQRRCGDLSRCLQDPAANLLYDASDRTLRVAVDCADLPYVLRAYFAFKRGLPFAFVSRVRGVGDDPRYLQRTAPQSSTDRAELHTPREVLATLRRTIHSGMYRMAPEAGGDFYPVAVRRGAIGPGAIFYDPNGHVLMVAHLSDDGVVSFIDAHPDGSLTYRRFGAAFDAGPRSLGGGFKRFRPLRLRAGRAERVTSEELADFDGASQWDRGPAGPYHARVRAALQLPGATTDGARELEEQLAALCRAARERVEAVELARPLARRPRPGALPPNIYGAEGEWETYATAARDARLKGAVREIDETVRAQLHRGADRAALAALLRDGLARCRLRYRASDGAAVDLDLGDALDRLFRLSFDPWHCPELRWGAPPGSAELGRCPDGPERFRRYDEQARLRRRIDRVYGVPTPLADGPEADPAIDPRVSVGLRP